MTSTLIGHGFNSLVPGSNFKSVISEHMLQIKFMSTSCEIAMMWMPRNTSDDMSTLVQVMKQCLSQCWPRSMSYGISRPLWVNAPDNCFNVWASFLSTTEQCMMMSSNENIFCITGHLCREFTSPSEFPTQRPVTWSFDVFFDLCVNKWLSKEWWGWWLEMPSCPLWRHPIRDEVT